MLYCEKKPLLSTLTKLLIIMGLAWTDHRAKAISKMMDKMMYHQHYSKKFTVFLDCLIAFYSRGEILVSHEISKDDQKREKMNRRPLRRLIEKAMASSFSMAV